MSAALRPQVVASAPGKVLLLGDYAVLEGAPALVMAVDRRVQVRVVGRPGAAASRVDAPQVGLVDAALSWCTNAGPDFLEPALAARPELDLLRGAVAQALAWTRQQGHAVAPVHLTVDSADFFRPAADKLGLGSSAALSAAVIAALAHHWGAVGPAPDDLWQLARAAHAAGHAPAGSGVDVAASVWGGLLRFRRWPDAPQPEIVPLRPWAALHLLILDTGAAAATAPLVAQVGALREHDPSRYWSLFERLALLSRAGTEFWGLQQMQAFTSVVEAYHVALVELGEAAEAAIVSPVHLALHAEARAVGAWYKSSGAGGADIGVAFCESARSARRLARRAVAVGAQPLALEMAAQGAVAVAA